MTNGHYRRLTGSLLSGTVAGWTSVALAMEVNFAAPAMVAVVGEPVEVAVQIDYEVGERPDLFSFGVRLVPDQAEGLGVKKIEAVPELDHRGFVAGALESEEELGVKGNVSLGGEELVPYRGGFLACFLLTVDRPGVVELSLDFFRTAGPQEDIFVTTEGTTLDSTITFGSATLHVIEDPRFLVEKAPGGNAVEVSFRTVPGLRYVVLGSDDLRNWKEIASVRGAGFARETLTEPIDTPTWFFRLAAESGP